MTEGKPLGESVFRQRGVNAARRVNAVLSDRGEEALDHELTETIFGSYFGNVIRTHIVGPATGPLRFQALFFDASLQLHDEMVAKQKLGEDITSISLSLKVLTKLNKYISGHPDLKFKLGAIDFVEE